MGSKIAIYPGTFDPVTNGHIDIIDRALTIFDRVRVVVATNLEKETLFTSQERVQMLKKALKGRKGITIDVLDGLVIKYARKHGARVVIRGLRMISDFEYEFQMALTNRKLEPKVETFFLMPSENYSYVSSRLIKEAVSLGANVKDFVPAFVAKALNSRLKV